MNLSLDEANRIAQGAIDRAEALGIRISAAVCDAGGRLVAFQRMNGAIWAGAYGSQGKAVASAAFGTVLRTCLARRLSFRRSVDTASYCLFTLVVKWSAQATSPKKGGWK